MLEIDVSFLPEFGPPMLAGKKTCTSRNSKLGERGDIFPAFGATFEIIAVKRLGLFYVSHHLYRYEGFNTPEEFIDCWNRIHPRAQFDPLRQVYTHFFKRIDAHND
jgi:hypothetical protein